MKLIRFRGVPLSAGLVGLDDVAQACAEWFSGGLEEAPADRAPALVVEACDGLPWVARRRRLQQGWWSRADDGDDMISLGRLRLVLRPGRPAHLLAPAEEIEQAGLHLQVLLGLALAHLLALQGGLFLHSCAFTACGARVLALGCARSGKSTLAVAALAAGGRVLSDDAIGAVLDDDGPLLGALREGLALRAGSLDTLPGWWRQRVVPAESEGETRWLLGRNHEAFVQNVRPDRIWDLRLDRRRQRSDVRPLSQGEAFAALVAASSPLFLSQRYPVERTRLLPVLTALAAVPAWRVRLGRDIIHSPGALARLAAQTGSSE